MGIFELYLMFTVIPNLNNLSGALLLLGIVGTITALVAAALYNSECKSANEVNYKEFTVKVFKFLTIPCLSLSLLLSFAPTDKQIAIIVGGHVATNIEGAEKLPENLVKAANDFLENLHAKDKS